MIKKVLLTYKKGRCNMENFTLKSSHGIYYYPYASSTVKYGEVAADNFNEALTFLNVGDCIVPRLKRKA